MKDYNAYLRLHRHPVSRNVTLSLFIADKRIVVNLSPQATLDLIMNGEEIYTSAHVSQAQLPTLANDDKIELAE